jgi:hypothetical protein
MTEPQRAESGEVLINPSTGMPETRQERDQREERNQQRQKDASAEAANKGNTPQEA